MDSTKMEIANPNPTFGSSLLNDATSSSSALAAPCGTNVANRAREEQTEGPAVERPSLGTVNDQDPRHDPNSPVHCNETSKLDPEVVQAEFASEHYGVMVVSGQNSVFDVRATRKGRKHFKSPVSDMVLVVSCMCTQAVSGLPYPVSVLRCRMAHMQNEDDEIKSERPGSDSGYRKTEHDLKKEHDDLKRKHEVFNKTLILRQAYSDFEKTKEFEDMNIEIKEELLKLLTPVAGKNENFKMIVRKTLYTKILRTMFVQKVNMALRGSFRDIAWRNHYFFPKFRNHDPDYKWWEQNYTPKILEKRLEILREAAKKWNSEQDIFMVIELVTDMNSTLHPRKSKTEAFEMFSLATTICSLRSGGDSKI